MAGPFKYEANPIFDELTQGEDAPFNKFRLLIFAACVGFAHHRFVESPGKDLETRWMFIQRDNRLRAILMALTYADQGEPEVILDEDLQVQTLQGYGAGGSQIIEGEVLDQPGSNLDNLISFIRENRDEEELTEQVGILEDIEQDISGLSTAQD
jgi:hypothetical protein